MKIRGTRNANAAIEMLCIKAEITNDDILKYQKDKEEKRIKESEKRKKEVIKEAEAKKEPKKDKVKK